jgi:pimeloyl-ACP methyl ester carboxylesterase
MTDVVDLPAVDALERAAIRHELPCGSGTMVWRAWGEGRPVVLLHGGSGSWNHWVRNIAPLVDSGRRVLVPDLPGFGESALPPAGTDADALPEPVEDALRALLGDAECDLVGFSLGAMVGGFIAAHWPARARRLVLAGAPALGIPRAPWIGLRPWADLPEGPERDAAHRANLEALMLAGPVAIDSLAVALHARNMARDRMKKRRIALTDVLLRTLRHVRCPVYGIWGERDALYRDRNPLLAPALAAARDFRGLTLVPEAGHWVQFQQPVAFNAALARALAG